MKIVAIILLLVIVCSISPVQAQDTTVNSVNTNNASGEYNTTNQSDVDSFYYYKRSLTNAELQKLNLPQVLDYHISQKIYFKNTIDQKMNGFVKTYIYFRQEFTFRKQSWGFKREEIPLATVFYNTINKKFYTVLAKDGRYIQEFNLSETEDKNPEEVLDKKLLTRMDLWSEQDTQANQGIHKILGFITFSQRHADNMMRQARELDAILEYLEQQKEALPLHSPERIILEKQINAYTQAFIYDVENGKTFETVFYAGVDIFLLAPGFFEITILKYLEKLQNFKWIARLSENGGTLYAKILARMAIPFSAVGKLAQKAFFELPLESQVLLRTATEIGVKPLIAIKTAAQYTAGRFMLVNELFAKKVAQSPGLEKILELFFPIHLSFTKEVIPILKRNMLWSMTTQTIGQYLARRDKFFQQLDEVAVDVLIVNNLNNIFYSPWQVLARPENPFISHVRRYPSAAISGLMDVPLTHIRANEKNGFDEKEVNRLIKRFESTFSYASTVSNSTNLAADAAQKQLSILAKTRPDVASLVEVIFRLSMGMYTTSMRIISRNQTNPYLPNTLTKNKETSKKVIVENHLTTKDYQVLGTIN